MKKIFVGLTVIVVITIIAFGVVHAIGEAEQEKEQLIRELEESMTYDVEVNDFLAIAHCDYGDYRIEAKVVMLPYNYGMWSYTVTCCAFDGYTCHSEGMLNTDDTTAVNKLNEGWYEALWTVIENTEKGC